VKYFEIKNWISCKIHPITYSSSYKATSAVSQCQVKYDHKAAADPSTSEAYSQHTHRQTDITKLITLYINTAPSYIKIEYFNASAIGNPEPLTSELTL